MGEILSRAAKLLIYFEPDIPLEYSSAKTGEYPSGIPKLKDNKHTTAIC